MRMRSRSAAANAERKASKPRSILVARSRCGAGCARFTHHVVEAFGDDEPGANRVQGASRRPGSVVGRDPGRSRSDAWVSRFEPL